MEVAGDPLALGVAGIDGLLEQRLPLLRVLFAFLLLGPDAPGREDEEALAEE